MKTWQSKAAVFLTSQTISLFGSSLVQYALLWHITLSTQSGKLMAGFIICGFLPVFFLSPFAGVWADRYNRKMLIILSDGMIAFATLILAVFFYYGYRSLGLIFVFSAWRALGTAVQNPAVSAILPQIVPESSLTRVNAINGSIQSAIMLISPLAGGALLATTSLQNIFLIDVLTASLAIAILLFFLPIEAHAKAQSEEKSGYFADLKEGLLYIKEHEYIRQFFIFCALFFFLVSPSAFLTPLQVVRSFGEDVWRLTAIEVTFSLGMILGGGLIAWWGGFRQKIYTLFLATIAIAIFNVALGITDSFIVYLVCMAVIGVAIPLFNTPSMVLLQEKVEINYLGRVFGVLGMISSSVMPVAMLLFGPLADLFSIEWMLIITGLLMVLLSFFLLRSKSLLEAGQGHIQDNK